MKAILYRRYGSPDVLQLTEVDKPTPEDNQVLVQVHAASANVLDWRFTRSSPFLMRLQRRLLRPKNSKLGVDVAGQIEAVGENAEQFQLLEQER